MYVHFLLALRLVTEEALELLEEAKAGCFLVGEVPQLADGLGDSSQIFQYKTVSCIKNG